jgi:flagellum-specific ATP synthase
MSVEVDKFLGQLERINDHAIRGSVSAVKGLMVEVGGVNRLLSVGDRFVAEKRDGREVLCEVVGMRDSVCVAMPFGSTDGLGLGSPVRLMEYSATIFPDESWLGRVLDALGREVDGKGRLLNGAKGYRLRNAPISAHVRQRMGEKLDLGVRSLNTFTSCCRGQRMGIFAGSGVGKSMLLAMMSLYSEADVIVIGLVGERGREAREFIEDYLGEEGMRKAVVVVSTSDEPAMMRREAAYLTLSLAEYFRDQGKEVLCLIDSVTRFAMAQREIGLSVGEPPTSKGYTPTVFVELPRLLERAGPGAEGTGNITGLFTVLVEGDDFNEPISDAVRGILDGHIVLDRAIAHRNRYPAVNVLQSISRSMPDCNTEGENNLVNRARELLATYEDMGELVRIGAYRKGSDPKVDEAIYFYEKLEEFQNQRLDEKVQLARGYEELRTILESREDEESVSGGA